MPRTRFLLMGIGVLLLLLVAIASMRLLAISFSPAEISLSDSRVDLGDIPQDGGPVTAMVTVQNTGKQNLQINRLSTSCGCTTAQMDTSPLPPGASRTLTIQFDPMTHPDQNGPITRMVYIQSNDPDAPEKEIEVVGNVIPIQPL